MRYLLCIILLVFSINTFAQDSPMAESLTSEISSLNKEIEKLEKSIEKDEKNLEAAKNDFR